MRWITIFALTLAFGVGGAVAQGSGGAGGGAGGGGAGAAGSGGGTAGSSGGGGGGSGGGNTGPSNNGKGSAQQNPTAQECARGWTSSMSMSQADFRAACGNR
jgi:hypothetical protein